MNRIRMKKQSRIVSAALAALMLLPLLSGCAVFDYVFGSGTTAAPDDTSAPEVTRTPEVTTSPDTGTGAVSDVTTEDVTQPPAVTAEDTKPGPVIYYNDPLTGLRTVKNVTGVRPVAIIVDNLSAAAPQSGLSRADILIECMVESGISRLILITNKYESNEAYGPVRSARDYIVSLSQAFGTLLIGAGYSPTAYTAISESGMDYIDGVHDRYAMSGFFRDPERYSAAGYEHSLMISGQGIKALAAHNDYTLAASGVSVPFTFSDAPAIAGSDATHAVLTYSAYQQVQLIYSKKDNAYYRYQYGTKAHLDAETGEQLNFANVFILFAEQHKIPDDTEGRISVAVSGSGTGYFLTGGKYIPINWTRGEGLTSPFAFTTSDGGKFTVSRGKTFIAVVDSALKGTSSINLNYKLG